MKVNLRSAFERRALTDSTLSRPQSWLVDMLGGGSETYSGKSVTPETAMSLVPVYSAVTLLAGAVATLPLIVYRQVNETTRERARNHRTWAMLHDTPNELMGADEFWEIIMGHLLLWGNAYAVKGRGSDGLVNELVPLHPGCVTVDRDRNGVPVYTYGGKKAGPDQILHFRGLGVNGRVGLSPIQQARQMLGNVLALEEFQGRFWGNNARPGGVLTHPGELNEKAQRRLAKSWDVINGGLANAGKTAVLEEGVTWQALGIPLADAQFVEQQQYTRSDVALLFRVPPHMLAASSGDSLTYSTTEGHSLDFVTWSLARWLRRLEGTLVRDPDIFLQGSRFFPEFLVDALLRTDSKTRAEVNSTSLDPVTGWLDVDEVRGRENLPPLTPEQLDRREKAATSRAPKPAEQKPGNHDAGTDPQNGG